MVKHKPLGVILVVIGIFFLISIVIFKMQIDDLATTLMLESDGVCILDGKCVHEQSDFPVYLGGAFTFITLALGFYLLFFDKSQKYANRTNKEIVKVLQETKKKQTSDEKFNLVLKGLSSDEKKVVKAVKDQDGIEQATLRIRTDLSKTKLSVVLSDLEKKNFIKKIPQGKKNKIYLKIAF